MRQYFEERLGYRPRICVWEITLACNSRCLHCGSFAGKPRDDELDTPEALSVAGQLADLGCERVTLSGGEPLLRKDWHLLGEALTRRGVRVGLISNGLAFDDEVARRAAGFGIESVAFSIDGLEANHQKIRSVPNSFRRVLAAVETAHRSGLAVCAVTHVNQWNLGELQALHGTLREAGIRTWKVQLSNPAGEMAACRDMVLAPRDLLRLVPVLLEIRKRGLPFLEISDSIGYFGPHERTLRKTWRDEIPFWMGCAAGMRAVGIESNGNVKGCLALPSQRHGCDDFVEGNVRARSLADIWCDPDAFAYNRKFSVDQLTGFCRTCPYGEICRAGCHWTALSHFGTIHENRLCVYRVMTMQAGSGKDKRPWLPSCLAPAFLMATLGFAGCYASADNHGGVDGDAAAEIIEDRAEGAVDPVEVADTAPDVVPDPPAEVVPDAVPDVTPDVTPPYCPTSEEQVCCFVCEGQTMWRGEGVTCEQVEASCSDDYAGPVPIPADCADPCCPTAEEACCFCEYAGPIPIPPSCPDPCEPPNDSLYADPAPIPDDKK
jgi:radical SAM protein with 4Fe4S-binding SPASM domain